MNVLAVPSPSPMPEPTLLEQLQHAPVFWTVVIGFLVLYLAVRAVDRWLDR